MIAFDLQCKNGHVFEGWFDSNEGFEYQKQKGLIECPFCNEASVDKIPSPFGLKKSAGKAVSPLPANNINALEGKEALTELSRQIYDFVEKNFDDVGSDFAKEALKIHYGVSEPRNIRGVSSKEEEKTLKDEGINVLKIPIPSEENNTDS